MQNSNVFFDVVMSLDGFIAPEGMDMAHANDPEYKQWMKKWMELQHWVFQQKFFLENLKLGEGGEIEPTGPAGAAACPASGRATSKPSDTSIWANLSAAAPASPWPSSTTTRRATRKHHGEEYVQWRRALLA